MRELAIDIETYSSYDLKSCGVYRYAEAPDFTILLFSYCIDGGEVICVDLAQGEQLPDEVFNALQDNSVIKTAFNATFERICISHYFGWSYIDPSSWRCTMVRSARMGLPLSLGQCAEVLKLEEGKMTEGRSLINYFSKPYKGKRRLPSDSPERWKLFKEYNIRDVEVEQAILAKVRRLESPKFDDDLYVVDQLINDRGVLLHRELATNATRFDDEYKAELQEEAKKLTGLENPNSPTQLKEWLRRACGIPVQTLNKGSIDEIENLARYNPTALRVLAIRRELGKTSVKKYSAMLNCVCDDNRIRGLLQFNGASRTGRWAGRLVQVQNLPQNHLSDIDRARTLVINGDLDDFLLFYANPTQVLSELIRTAFVASPGRVFLVCDFSAIEARVIAWLAGEDWVLDVFRQGGDIYCATASQMFNCKVEKHGANSELRQKGKIAVLALGYGGGVAALEAMGGARMGLTQPEMRDIMTRWREANPRIVWLWSVIEQAAIKAIKTGESVTIHRGIVVSYRWGMLLITLPSGRTLCYPRAKMGVEYSDRRGQHEVIEYEGSNQTTKKWEVVRTYGGKLTENVVQAIARDILGVIILRAHSANLNIVFHVHDEIVVEAEPHQTLSMVEQIFSDPINWCRDLPLKGTGYSTPYYLKD